MQVFLEMFDKNRSSNLRGASKNIHAPLNVVVGVDSTNASREENREALIEDSQAFGIGCTVFSIGQFIVGAISVDIFNYMALKQVILNDTKLL